jgi:hypothetical protein
MLEVAMINVTDIHPLTGFLRDHKTHIERLEATGNPEVLTVNGRARVVVQDAIAYQRLLDAADAWETEQVLRARTESVLRGEPGIPANEVLADVRKALGIAR